ARVCGIARAYPTRTGKTQLRDYRHALDARTLRLAIPIGPTVPPTEEEPVLEEFMGVPVHPLLVHAAVVFVPLLALLTAGYAFLPFIRPHTRWILGLLALAGPLAALLAKLSGDRFFNRMMERELVTPSFIPRLEEHQNLGTMTLWVTIALAVLTLAQVYLVVPGSGVLGVRSGEGSRRILS